MKIKVIIFVVTAMLASFGVAMAQNYDDSCWGQATAVFARMGEMGEHASQQEEPRVGLANLARQLYDDGIIPDDSLQALGSWVNQVLNLEIGACIDSDGASRDAARYAITGAFTTVNEEWDGPDHCFNGDPYINCNLYDAKEYVWLNGGPTANGLGPDGEYFFAVLVPGPTGQPNPNDGGPDNLSDDYDSYTNRAFTVTEGKISSYSGTHDYDSHIVRPTIRAYPYADTTNPGGVYVLAVCALADGYPVNPSDCGYDLFMVAAH